MDTVAVWRLYLLRAGYLVLLLGLAWQYWPRLGGDIAAMPVPDSAVAAMLSAMGLLAIIGLFSPLRMLPLMLFEIAWKLIWLATVALPRWQAGRIDAAFGGALFAIGMIVPFLFLVPWDHVARVYFGRMEAWK